MMVSGVARAPLLLHRPISHCLPPPLWIRSCTALALSPGLTTALSWWACPGCLRSYTALVGVGYWSFSERRLRLRAVALGERELDTASVQKTGQRHSTERQ